MKKFILLFLMFFVLSPLAFCEDFPPSGKGIPITKETNPVYFGYMEDYATKLKDALEAKKMFRLRGMGASYVFFITRDGEIQDMTKRTYHGEYFYKKVKEIILSVKPLPFREGMNLDKMQFCVYLGYEPYDDITLSVGRAANNIRIFHILITTSK